MQIGVYGGNMSTNNENIEEINETVVVETPVAPPIVQMPPKPTIDQFGTPSPGSLRHFSRGSWEFLEFTAFTWARSVRESS